MTQLTGAYAVEGGGEPVTIGASNGQLTFGLAGRSRNLRHKGSLEFSPAGADNVASSSTSARCVSLAVTIPRSCCGRRRR